MASAPPSPDHDEKYDLFVSYAADDTGWVEGFLLKQLQRAGITCHTETAFELGKPRVKAFEDAVRRSHKILLVISPHFLSDGTQEFVRILGISHGMNTGTWPVIPLYLRPVIREKIPETVRALSGLDATSPENWRDVVVRLCQAFALPVTPPETIPPCPYPGMERFDESKSPFFFGREREVSETLGLLRQEDRFLALIGASGSGKSSLVLAGLVPALRAPENEPLFGSRGWLVKVVRPGRNPQASLEGLFGSNLTNPPKLACKLLTSEPNARSLLIVIDAFEEVFSARVDIMSFFEAIKKLIGTENCYLVLAVRADFYANLMSCPLWPWIRGNRYELRALDRDGLRDAILKPAEKVGAAIENELVERLVSHAADQPGSLPFLQETLVLLWPSLQENYLPLYAYETLGNGDRTGIEVAMQRRADAALNRLSRELGPDAEPIVQRIFLRLIQFGEGRPDTRRQRSIDDLRSSEDDTPLFDKTIDYLTDAKCRLITLGGGNATGRRADIAHESLIRGWPTLGGWIAELREAELTRRRLEDKATEWRRLGSWYGGLLDAAELREAQNWIASPDSHVLGYNKDLTALISASRRSVWVQRTILTAIPSLIIIALGVLWSNEKTTADLNARLLKSKQNLLLEETTRAKIAEDLAAEHDHRAREAERFGKEQELLNSELSRALTASDARRLATEARSLLAAFPQRGLLLALESLDLTTRRGEPSQPASEQVLRESLSNFGWCHTLVGHSDQIVEVEFSQDGRWLGTGSTDKKALLWDIRRGIPAVNPLAFDGLSGPVNFLAFDPSGHWLVMAYTTWSAYPNSGDAKVLLWDLTAIEPSKHAIPMTGLKHSVRNVVFSPDGHQLATADLDGTILLWNLQQNNPANAPQRLFTNRGAVNQLAFSPTGRWLVSRGDQEVPDNVILWRLDDDGMIDTRFALKGHGQRVLRVAFSPEGKLLITASFDTTARVWDLSSGDPTVSERIVINHKKYITETIFSQDRKWLVTGSEESIRLWKVAGKMSSIPTFVLEGDGAKLSKAAVSLDGRWLAASYYDGPVRLWDLKKDDPSKTQVILRDTSGVWGADDSGFHVVFSVDSRWLATLRADGNTPRLWDLDSPRPESRPIRLVGHDWPVAKMVFSSDNRWLATVGTDRESRLWDLTSYKQGSSPLHDPVTKEPAPFPVLLNAHERGVEKVLFPDRARMITMGEKSVRLWSLTDERPAASSHLLSSHKGAIMAMTITPDGRWLAVGSFGEAARLIRLDPGDSSYKAVRLPEFTKDTGVIASNQTGNQFFLLNKQLACSFSNHHGSFSLSWRSDFDRPREDRFNPAVFSPDCRWLIVGGNDGALRAWKITSVGLSKQAVELPSHEKDVYGVEFSPDGRRMATTDLFGALFLWLYDATGGEFHRTYSYKTTQTLGTVAFSDDGRWMAAGRWNDGAVLLWDLTGERIGDPTLLRGHERSVWRVSFSRDSEWLGSTSDDGTFRVWHLKGPRTEPLGIILGTGSYSYPFFTPDNVFAGSIGNGDSVYLWALQRADLIRLARQLAGRNLSPAEWARYLSPAPYRKTFESFTVPTNIR
jgi:WD40 repeat protein